MNRRHFLQGLLAIGSGVISRAAADQPILPPPQSGSANTGSPTTGLNLTTLGRVRARSAREITASSWSIGGETLDRDFAVYENYKQYLGPLGAKSIRLQAGWAKCEQRRGTYSWQWLDTIIDDALAQGIRPWVELSYGNTLYPGGGDTGLGGGLPSSPEGLAAWERWTRGLIERYRDRVHEWEIWNEPDINRAGTATVERYADLYTRTATIVRDLQPRSRLFALALAHNIDYANQFITLMKERGRFGFIDAITVHGYPRNPDDTTNIDRLRQAIARAGGTFEVRQGETGAPSRFQERFALSNIHWTEITQAKWNLRRMLAHHAKGVPFNLFTISDMHYRRAGGGVQMNYKGLLATNPDKIIARVKPSYHAAQVVFTIFDNTLQAITPFPFQTSTPRPLAVSAFGRRQGGSQVVALWFKDAPPVEANETTAIEISFREGSFTDPVLIDVRTGIVYELPRNSWSQGTNGMTIRRLPVYDAPMLIAERSVVTSDK